MKLPASGVFATVAIPTFRRSDFLEAALQSVLAQKTSFPFEVVVVDNGCDPALQARVAQTAQNAPMPLSYVSVAEIGLHNSRHAAARQARGEVVVYIDDDVITPPGWLEAMLQPYSDPVVACVGGKTVPKWEAEVPAWINQFGENGSGYLSMLDLGPAARELAWPEMVFGCNMSVRRSILFELGGFNPDAIGEKKRIWLRGDGETGLHAKIYASGHKVIYSPSAWLYHRVPAARLQPKYFYWRAFIQGISDSYSLMRSRHQSVPGLIRHSLHCFLRALRAYLNALRQPGNYYQRSQAWYWYGRGQHQARLAISPVLRRHVLQKSYLNNTGLQEL